MAKEETEAAIRSTTGMTGDAALNIVLAAYAQALAV